MACHCNIQTGVVLPVHTCHFCGKLCNSLPLARAPQHTHCVGPKPSPSGERAIHEDLIHKGHGKKSDATLEYMARLVHISMKFYESLDRKPVYDVYGI